MLITVIIDNDWRKRKLFSLAARLYGGARAHHEFNCTRSRCILRAIFAADLCTERVRVQIPRRARRAFIVIPFSLPGNFHLRVRDPCGGERNAKYAAPRRAEQRKRRRKETKETRIFVLAVDIARRESFISHSRAMRLMGDGACSSRHAECTRRKKLDGCTELKRCISYDTNYGHRLIKVQTSKKVISFAY